MLLYENGKNIDTYVTVMLTLVNISPYSYNKL